MPGISFFASGRGSNALNILKNFSCGDRGTPVALGVSNNPKGDMTEGGRGLGVHGEVFSNYDKGMPNVMLPLLNRHWMHLIVMTKSA